MGRDPTTSQALRKGDPEGKRGVALIVALLVVTILTVTTLEFHFESQVDMQVALGKRDGFKAYLIASSGIRVAEKLLFEQFLAGKDPVTFDDVPSIEEINRLLAEACAQAAEASGKSVPEGLENLPIDLSAGGIDTGCGAPATLPVVELYKFAEVGEGDSLDISFEDEDSKINLNALVDPNGRVVPSLRNLLEAFLLTTLIDPETGAPEIAEVELGGFRKQEFTPTHLANAIIDWMDADDVPLDGGGFEEDFYDYPYEIKNNPFETLNELRFVKGVAEYALLDRLGCYFTVDSNTVQINVNRTPLPVLRAMILAAFADGETNPFDYLDVANEIMEAIDERRRQTPLVQLVAKYLQCPFEPPEAACGSGPFQTPKGSARQRSRDTKGLTGFLDCLNRERNLIDDPLQWRRVTQTLASFVQTTSKTFKIRAVARVNGVTSVVSTIVRSTRNGYERLYWREEPALASGVWEGGASAAQEEAP